MAGRQRRPEKLVKHPFENNPPAQDKYVNGDDNWKLKGTACPLDSPKVSSDKRDGGVLAVPRYGIEIHDPHKSMFITESHTNGKTK